MRFCLSFICPYSIFTFIPISNSKYLKDKTAKENNNGIKKTK